MGFNPPEIKTLVLGQLNNNTFLFADTESGEAAVIDPSFESREVISLLKLMGWKLKQIWLTHAHFDHIAGVNELYNAVSPAPEIYLHPADLDLYRQGGDASYFGFKMPPLPEPQHLLEHGQYLTLGSYRVEVKHVPGHTPGHVLFYSHETASAFCGDLIFYHSIGRTDFPGGSLSDLLRSVQSEILTLPKQTRLLSGHGPETTVAEEAGENPFLQQHE